MIIGRVKEKLWLDRFTQFNRLIAVTGIRGVGKTTLLREWLNSDSRRRVQWVIVERYRPLNAILGLAEASVEASLQMAGERWNIPMYVIWDDIHLLSSAARHTLLSFLKSSPGACTHVVVSDEDLAEALTPEEPKLHLQPFQLNETEEFVTALLGPEQSKQARQAHKSTGGVPLMLNLWVQNCSQWNFVRDTLLADLDKDSERILCAASLLDRPFSLQELSNLKLVASLPDALIVLKRKFLITSQEDLFQVPRPIQDLVLQGLSEDLRRSYERDVLMILKTSKSIDVMEFFIHALHARDAQSVFEVLHQITQSHLERLAVGDLSIVCGLMAEIASNLDHQDQMALFQQAQLHLGRLRVHAHWICGERDQAIDLGMHLLESLEEKQLSDIEQFLVLEVITLLNRSDRREAATQLLQKFLRRTQEPVYSLLRVEQMFFWIQSDTTRAMKGFEELLTSPRLQSPEDQWSLLTAAQAQFQLGRIYGLSGQFNNSEAAYKRSEAIYEKLDRPYFAAVSLLNQAWVALHQRDQMIVRERCQKLKGLAERFGYDYVLAGIYIIEATIHRLDLEGGAALDKIESALSTLPATAPRAARVDALSEKIRILAELGLHEKATQQISQIEEILGKQTESLRFECQLFDAVDDDCIDKWRRSLDQAEEFWCYQLERGRETPSDLLVERLRKSRKGQLALAQAETLTSLREQDIDQVWQGLAKLENLLRQISEPRPERIAALLLEAQLTDVEKKRADLLERAEIELIRWSGDDVLKAPLKAWHQGIQSKQNIERNPMWLKSRHFDRERWSCWWQPLNNSSTLSFIVVSSHGSLPCSRLEEVDTRHGIVVIEPMGEVYYQGKIISEFHRKPLLRQFLVALLSAGADGLAKASLASTVWGESYSPEVHDTRIYTSVQRIRGLLGDEIIQTWNSGYRVNPAFEFKLVQSAQRTAQRQHRIQSLVLQALANYQQHGKDGASRADLLEITASSEATLKRALAQLVSQSLIVREGHGPSVRYRVTPVGARSDRCGES